MPGYVVERVVQALSDRAGKAISRARILLIGVAYKKDVDDMRESPALKLIDKLEGMGANVDYHDPFFPEMPLTRAYPALAGRRSTSWEPDRFAQYDLALICTDHSTLDYDGLVAAVPIVVDTRNATRNVSKGRDRIVKA